MTSWNFQNIHNQTGVLTKSSTGTWSYVPNDGDSPDNEYLTVTATTVTWQQIGEYQDYARYTWPASHSSGDIVSSSGTAITGFTHNWGHTSLGGSEITITQIQSGPTVTYGPSHGALPSSTGFTVYDLNFTKVGDREYKISYQQKNAPQNSYTVRVGVYNPTTFSGQNIDYTVTTAASGQTINLKSGSLYGTGPQAASTTPSNGDYIQMRFMNFDAKLGSAGSTVGQGLIFQSWTYLYNNLTATFTPSSGVPGTIFNFSLTGSDDSYASSNTATLTDPSGNVTTFTKNVDGQFQNYVTNVTSIEGDYTVQHPSGVNRSTSTFDNSGTPIVETTSNEGGKRRRYPIISTNLFDRQRSIFSIGLTHKDETLF